MHNFGFKTACQIADTALLLRGGGGSASKITKRSAPTWLYRGLPSPIISHLNLRVKGGGLV